ncbi:MAG: heavy metal-responsive transcriptional regulator [Streptosporangiaceae bacterium]
MRIGELAAASGITTKTIRFYEQAGLLPAPPRTHSGYRDYPPGIRGRLTFIREAASAGLLLGEIRDILALRDSGQAPCGHVTGLLAQHLQQIEQRIRELEHTRRVLRDLHVRAAATDPADCAEAGICTILATPPPAAPPGSTAHGHARAGSAPAG